MPRVIWALSVSLGSYFRGEVGEVGDAGVADGPAAAAVGLAGPAVVCAPARSVVGGAVDAVVERRGGTGAAEADAEAAVGEAGAGSAGAVTTIPDEPALGSLSSWGAR